jgi:hypothetical protein
VAKARCSSKDCFENSYSWLVSASTTDLYGTIDISVFHRQIQLFPNYDRWEFCLMQIHAAQFTGWSKRTVLVGNTNKSILLFGCLQYCNRIRLLTDICREINSKSTVQRNNLNCQLSVWSRQQPKVTPVISSDPLNLLLKLALELKP